MEESRKTYVAVDLPRRQGDDVVAYFPLRMLVDADSVFFTLFDNVAVYLDNNEVCSEQEALW